MAKHFRTHHKPQHFKKPHHSLLKASAVVLLLSCLLAVNPIHIPTNETAASAPVATSAGPLTCTPASQGVYLATYYVKFSGSGFKAPTAKKQNDSYVYSVELTKKEFPKSILSVLVSVDDKPFTAPLPTPVSFNLQNCTS